MSIWHRPFAFSALTFVDSQGIDRNIENDWLDDNWASDYGTPEFLTSDRLRASTAVEPASQAAERVDQLSGEYALSLLRLSGWERNR